MNQKRGENIEVPFDVLWKTYKKAIQELSETTKRGKEESDIRFTIYFDGVNLEDVKIMKGEASFE